MSIETDINRMATALEELVKIGRGGVASVATPPKTPPKASPVTTPLGKKDPVAPPPAATDPLTGNPVVASAVTYTQEQVHQALQAFMEKNGVEPVKALMIKHGASKAKPTITSIPPANYAALVAEASA